MQATQPKRTANARALIELALKDELTRDFLADFGMSASELREGLQLCARVDQQSAEAEASIADLNTWLVRFSAVSTDALHARPDLRTQLGLDQLSQDLQQSLSRPI